MKFQHGILYLFLSIGLLLNACSSDEKSNEPPKFEMSESDLTQNFEKDQATVSIPVTTNLKNSEWSVESDKPDWCLVTQDNSSTSPAIKLLVKANTEPDVRTSQVTVKSPVKNYAIQVSQLGYGKAILLKSTAPVVGSDGGEVSVTVTANVDYNVVVPADCDWIQEVTKTRGLADYDHYFGVAANPVYADRSATVSFVCADDPTKKADCKIVQQSKETGISDVELEGDIKIQPIGGVANQYQPNQNIENTWDGKFSSDRDAQPFHSPWGDGTTMPVILEYYFDGTQNMDYLLYYTRSGNGNFGKVDIYTATAAEPEYVLLGNYDFRMQNAASRVTFPTSRPVTKVKFVVKTGAGGYASCDEMEFYGKNTDRTLDRQLLEVFTDLTCTQLKEEATVQTINALPSYFASLGMHLLNGTYDEWEKDFRIRDYKAYSNVEDWAERLMTKKYSNLDNPTGIYAEAGDTIIVLVGDTHGQQISLQSIWETGTEYKQTASSGDMYFLQEGVNKIAIRNYGMLFVMYNTDITSPTAKPIKIHIPPLSGKVSGFFDLEEHKTDEKYAELLRKATFKYFCVRGSKIMFYFHRTRLLEFVPNNILSAINLWDNIIGWQQELMGIEDVRPSKVNNHLFAISPEGSYMWASDYQIGFRDEKLGDILLYDNVMAAKDNAWGPAHEIGHIHQRAINWPSSTESSNNLFSNYTLYKLGKYCSRGTELDSLAYYRCVKKQPWPLMGNSTHKNEDTELHMRMNWQLWNYYHRCDYKPDFWQKLFKLLREDPIVENDPGAGQLKFAMKACAAANENLTDFFEMWGFFVPVNTTIEQYGTWNYNVTETMIADAKAYMAQFPAPRHAFYYLEDRKNGDVGIGTYKVGDVGYWTQFKNDVKITQTVTYTQTGRTFTVSNGSEAVAFELRRGDNLLYFSNFYSFLVPKEVNLDGVKLYAVQADGRRIEAQKK